jgi:hypothetical protein
MTDRTAATQLNFDSLPPYQPRHFVPEGVNLIDRDTTVALYQRLLERPLHSVEELEAWVLDRSELESAVGQAGAVLYVRMTCQTDDEDRAKAYKEYVTTVVPALAPLSDKLDRKYITARDQLGMPATQPAGRYDVHDRALRADIELFRQENVELNRDVSLLSQEYQTLCGAMTVRFRGEERTLAQMGKFGLDRHRPPPPEGQGQAGGVVRQDARPAAAHRRQRGFRAVHRLPLQGAAPLLLHAAGLRAVSPGRRAARRAVVGAHA